MSKDDAGVGGVRAVAPYLIVRGADRAIAFYAEAFGARERYRLTEPGGKVGHAELEIGESVVMLAEEYPDFGAVGPGTLGGTPVRFHVSVPDADAAVRRAESAGATVLRAPKDEFYGERCAQVVDPFGHVWMLSSRVEEVSPAEMQRRFTAALGGG